MTSHDAFARRNEHGTTTRFDARNFLDACVDATTRLRNLGDLVDSSVFTFVIDDNVKDFDWQKFFNLSFFDLVDFL